MKKLTSDDIRANICIQLFELNCALHDEGEADKAEKVLDIRQELEVIMHPEAWDLTD